MKINKNKLLLRGIILDLIGMSTMLIPIAGTLVDLIWAPYAAKQMNDMYDGKKGKIASIIVFIEEILPGLDFIPTFTLMWLYTFVWKKPPQMQPIIIEVDLKD
ncbi:MAG: hypothetical protein ACI93P_001233 [bacterium]|jgi:hypothetical protein